MNDAASGARVKRVRIHGYDLARSSDVVNGDNVEPARLIDQLVTRNVVHRHPYQPPLLPRNDRLGGATELIRRTRLHLHEDCRLAIPRDDVDFAMPRAVATGKNCVPAAFEFGNSSILAGFA